MAIGISVACPKCWDDPCTCGHEYRNLPWSKRISMALSLIGHALVIVGLGWVVDCVEYIPEKWYDVKHWLEMKRLKREKERRKKFTLEDLEKMGINTKPFKEGADG